MTPTKCKQCVSVWSITDESLSASVPALTLLVAQFVETGWSHCQQRVGVFFSSQRFSQNKFTHGFRTDTFAWNIWGGGVPASLCPTGLLQISSLSREVPALIFSFFFSYESHKRKILLKWQSAGNHLHLEHIHVLITLFCAVHLILTFPAKLNKEADNFWAPKVHAGQKTTEVLQDKNLFTSLFQFLKNGRV